MNRRECPMHGHDCEGMPIFGLPADPSDPIWEFHPMGGCIPPSYPAIERTFDPVTGEKVIRWPWSASRRVSPHK